MTTVVVTYSQLIKYDMCEKVHICISPNVVVLNLSQACTGNTSSLPICNDIQTTN